MTPCEHIRHALALAVISAPGQRGIWELLDKEGPVAAYRKSISLHPPSTQEYITWRYPYPPLEAAGAILDACAKKGVEVIDYWHPDYPPLLRAIQNPPLVLFLRGTLPAGEFFSIVGTRASDPASSRTARHFAAALSRAGFAIASGMATGIDRAAHLGALEAGGATVGVLANGIDIAYPASNRDIFAAIVSSRNSCVVSEYPPGILAGKWTFARRNRIISGLSRGTLVVKAGDKSGALITARCAAEQGREVFACPGPALDESYAGCHRLIKSGAALAATPEDILREPGFVIPGVSLQSLQKVPDAGVTPERGKRGSTAAVLPASAVSAIDAYAPGTLERRILELVAPTAIVDELIRALGVPAGEVHEKLSFLEIEGAVRRTGNIVSLG
ncbi:MAG TPA: DNA-processing protein DprA [Spirochaetota bacterium]|nr:DNA-processing protein DprA [Spirochaetota bacterium]